MASITGTNGIDTLTGTVNDDVIYGLAGDDTIDGGNGNDIIVGGLGKDIMLGGAGNDEFLVGGTGILAGEVIDGGTGLNKVSTYDGDLSPATVTNVQTLGLFINKLKLSAAQLAGFSTVIAQTGTPATLTAANAGTYDLSTKTVTGIFNLTGSSGDDTLIGNAAAQTLDGGDGNDIIVGGLGADKLLGGADNDEFVLNNGDVVAGEIIDGGTGANKITAWGGDLSLATITNVPSLGVHTNALKLSAAQMAGFSTLTALDGVPVTLSATNAGTYDLSGKTVTGTFNLTGSTGDDTLTGNAAAQTLDGGNGNDTITGGLGADILLGGQGNDAFLLNVGDVTTGEVIDGGTGANKITAWGGDLSPATITNVQTLELHQGALKLSAAQLAAFNVLNALDGLPATLLAANAGKYDISNKNVTGVINLTGSVGNDTLIGNAAGQTLDGGDGNDILSGGLGADIMLGGAGNDEFQVGGTGIVAGEVIDGGSGANKLSTFDGDLSLATVTNVQTLGLYTNALKLSANQMAGFSKLYAFTGAATLTAANAGTYDLSNKAVTGTFNLMGSSGNDTLIGNAAAQTLNGGDGDDTISGGDGNDIISGGSGTDIMLGGAGDDEFQLNTEGVAAGEVIDGGTGQNTLRCGGGNLTLATITNIQNLVIGGAFALTPTQIGQFNSIRTTNVANTTFIALSAGVYDFRNKIDQDGFRLFSGSTGVTLIGSDSRQRFEGGLGDDTFYGYGGDDWFDGYGGNNTMYGGDGNDVFDPSSAGVNKFYGEGGDDKFEMLDFPLSPGSVIDGGAGNNTLVASAYLANTTITNIQTLITYGVTLSANQFAQFSNGTVWQAAFGASTIGVSAATAGTYDLRNIIHTVAFSALNGSDGNDVLIGDADAQNIYGNNGDDVIDGQDGNDILDGRAGNDTIIGGKGADTMLGGAGDDQFFAPYNQSTGTSEFESGEVIDGGSGDNTLTAAGNLDLGTVQNIQHLVVDGVVHILASQLGQFNTIRRLAPTPPGGEPPIVGITAQSAGVYDFRGKINEDNFVLVANEPGCTLIGTDNKQWFMGSGGDDVFYGYGGDDLFWAGGGNRGNDTMYGGDGNDRFDFIAGPGVIKLYGEGGDDIFYASGYPLSAGSIIDGGTGNNTLFLPEFIANTTILNIQTLKISYGLYLTADQFAQFSNGTVWQSINGQDDISVTGWSAGTYDLRNITHTSRFAFLGGSNGNDVLIGDADAQSISGRGGDDIIDGQGGDDTLYGDDGNDTIIGGGGADTMRGWAGDDVFQVNDGDVVAGEIIDGDSGDNTLKAGFAELHLATISNIQHLIIQDGVTLYANQLGQFSTIRRLDSSAADAASYKKIYALSTGTYDFRGKIDQDNFVILAGVPGCTLIGSDAKQWFWGDFGDDVFYGYGGDDIFYGSTGTNIAYGGDGNDTFNLTVPAVNKFYGEGGDDVFNLPLGGMLPGSIIDGGSGSNTLVGNGSITDLTFSNIQTLITDGLMLTADQLVQLSHGVVWQGQNNQPEIGISAASAGTYDLRGITHTARFSILFGSSGNDTLIGDADAQSIYGNNGDDIIDGQGGGDDAFGGTGNDTYRGSGMILHEDDSTIGNTDVLDLTNSAVAHDQLWFTQSGNDLDIFVLGRDHTIVKDWYLGSAHHVEQIKASDGLTLLDTQVQNLVNAMAGFAVPSTTTLSAAYHTALDPVLAANWT